MDPQDWRGDDSKEYPTTGFPRLKVYREGLPVMNVTNLTSARIRPDQDRTAKIRRKQGLRRIDIVA